MIYAILADAVVVLHFAFVVAAVTGGLLVLRWPVAAWGHLPILLWAALVELFGWPCPLTPLEVALRRAAGEAGFAGGFLDQYLWPILYPPGLTRGHQIALAGALLVGNALIYGWWWRRCRQCRHRGKGKPLHG